MVPKDQIEDRFRIVPPPRWFTGPCVERHGRQTAPLSYRTKHTFPPSPVGEDCHLVKVTWLVYLTWTTIALFRRDIPRRPARPSWNLHRDPSRVTPCGDPRSGVNQLRLPNTYGNQATLIVSLYTMLMMRPIGRVNTEQCLPI